MSRYKEALGDYPFMWVRVACDQCDHHGCYRLTNLVAAYGLQIDMYGVLCKLVDHCWRWNWKPGMPGEPCGAMLYDIHYDDPSGRVQTKKARPNLRIV